MAPTTATSRELRLYAESRKPRSLNKRRKRRSRIARRVFGYVAGAAVCVVAGVGIGTANGYQRLNAQATRVTADQTGQSDAIIVLSGGSGRIKTALELCKGDQQLLISGCNEGTTLAQIIAASGADCTELDYNNVTLGYDALKTEGNAMEIAQWLCENPRIQTVTIVTSDYHVARALYHLKQHIPGRIDLQFYVIESTAGLHTSAEEAAKIFAEGVVGYSGGPVIREQIDIYAKAEPNSALN